MSIINFLKKYNFINNILKVIIYKCFLFNKKLIVKLTNSNINYNFFNLYYLNNYFLLRINE